MADTGDDDYPFDWRSGDLKIWLEKQPGAYISPKVQLTDLRSRGAGRGVGTISRAFKLCMQATDGTMNSCCRRHRLGRRAFHHFPSRCAQHQDIIAEQDTSRPNLAATRRMASPDSGPAFRARSSRQIPLVSLSESTSKHLRYADALDAA